MAAAFRDVYSFYLDATPTSSYLRYLYKYPQAAYPYDDLVADERAAGRGPISSTSCSTRASSTTIATSTSMVEYAKATPDDIAVRITVTNRGPEAATLHLLPTLWFRNTWSWGGDDRDRRPAARSATDRRRPRRRSSLHAIRSWRAAPDVRGRRRAPVHRERDEHRAARGRAKSDAVREGRYRRLSRPRSKRMPSTRSGSARRRRPTIALTGRARRGSADDRGSGWSADGTSTAEPASPRSTRIVERAPRARRTRSTRRSSRRPSTRTPRCVMRQALAGMLWSKQDVPLRRPSLARASTGSTRSPPATGETAIGTGSTCRRRRHLDAGQVGVPVVRGLGPRLPRASR